MEEIHSLFEEFEKEEKKQRETQNSNNYENEKIIEKMRKITFPLGIKTLNDLKKYLDSSQLSNKKEIMKKFFHMNFVTNSNSQFGKFSFGRMQIDCSSFEKAMSFIDSCYFEK